MLKRFRNNIEGCIAAAVQPIVRIENLPCTLYNKVCQANVILSRRLVPGRLHDFAVRVRDSKGDQNSMQATISVTNATTSRDMIFPHVPSIIMVPEVRSRVLFYFFSMAR